MVVAAAEIKVSKLELEFELPQNVLNSPTASLRHFFFPEHDCQ